MKKVTIASALSLAGAGIALTMIGGAGGAVLANQVGDAPAPTDTVESVGYTYDLSNPFANLTDRAIASLRDALDIKDGVDGKDGAPGPKGDKGDPGDPASAGMAHWSAGGTVPAANKPYAQADPTDPTYMPGYVEVTATCPGDKLAVGGGYQTNKYKGGVVATLNKNTADAVGTAGYGKSWIVGYTNYLDTPVNVRTYVVCIDAVEDEPKS
ncbi:hypothetical protein E8D34_12555 [Nocardioides sp. GY 10113]|uniref:hypothetical protein n=1 Tax=Nocardioides sp. GY 10113 TaxID=2569761 RepID=UPI0010A7BFD1|nr:hypothetical protein [Nocardioides sp. GY 10113]TIC85925.1 hypothetical protein E8D34_12555 [Nocardioides sp. GY 10113]